MIRRSLTTNTYSSQFATYAEALQFIEPYMDLPSPVEDLAYHIVYYDNSQGVPGPSDWDMQFAFKVQADQVDLWLGGFSRSEPFELDWGYALSNTRTWMPVSQPRFYQTAGAWMAVFSEGVIFYRQSTLIN